MHVRVDCTYGYCINDVFADVTSNGRKLELMCSRGIPEKPYKGMGLLTIGDYHARIAKNASGIQLGDGYGRGGRLRGYWGVGFRGCLNRRGG